MMGERYLGLSSPLSESTQVGVMESTSTLGASHLFSAGVVRTVP